MSSYEEIVNEQNKEFTTLEDQLSSKKNNSLERHVTFAGKFFTGK